MPVGVVTLDEQPGEERAFGPWAPWWSSCGNCGMGAQLRAAGWIGAKELVRT